MYCYPQCPTCGVILTVKHLISECLKYEEDEKKCNIAYNIDAALGPNTEDIYNIINFLRKTDLPKQIYA